MLFFNNQFHSTIFHSLSILPLNQCQNAKTAKTQTPLATAANVLSKRENKRSGTAAKLTIHSKRPTQGFTDRTGEPNRGPFLNGVPDDGICSNGEQEIPTRVGYERRLPSPVAPALRAPLSGASN